MHRKDNIGRAGDKMNKIALISFNTCGTLGHMTLFNRIAHSLNKDHKVHLLSDYDLKINDLTPPLKIEHELFDTGGEIRSNGGQISHKSSEQIFEYCKSKNINYALFSTFFDLDLVNNLRGIGIKSIYISYPLRDTYSELFFLRQHLSAFDEVVVFQDLYDNNYPESVKRSNPILIPFQKVESNSAKILLTCGGGGRPSSVKFLELMEVYVPIMKDYGAEIVLIRGPNNKGIKIAGITSLESTNDLCQYIDEARIVVSEAGYFTTHELISRSKPSILIPGERRIDNQELRAIKYEERGFGYCVMPEESIDLLISRSLDLLINQKRYGQMQVNCQKYHSLHNPEENIENILRGLLS